MRTDGLSKPGYHRPDRKAPYDYLVVGAGFAGSVLAERLAAGSGMRVLVCDRRSHVAGNAYDHHDSAGILVHRYGPHIFHTNSEDVVRYLSRFTRWRAYEHRVLASVGANSCPFRSTGRQSTGCTG
jgi:UDP-galactopyranose mutase